MGRERQVRISPRQLVKVYSRWYWRMDVGVADVTPAGAALVVEANYPTWIGSPSAINRLTWHPCEVGSAHLFRLPVTSLLPIRREVRLEVAGVEGDLVVLHIRLPRGWDVETHDLPPDDLGEELGDTATG